MRVPTKEYGDRWNADIRELLISTSNASAWTIRGRFRLLVLGAAGVRVVISIICVLRDLQVVGRAYQVREKGSFFQRTLGESRRCGNRRGMGSCWRSIYVCRHHAAALDEGGRVREAGFWCP